MPGNTGGPLFIKELFKHWTFSVFAPGTLLRRKYDAFRSLLKYDDICLELIAEMEQVFYGDEICDHARVEWLSRRLSSGARMLIDSLQSMNPTRYMGLHDYFNKVDFYTRMQLDLEAPSMEPPFVIPLAEAAGNYTLAGGKAANLAYIAQNTDLPVPPGFVITTTFFNYYLEVNGLREALNKKLRKVCLSDMASLGSLCEEMAELVLLGEIPDDVADEIKAATAGVARGAQTLAVRSSATAEDGDSSFAGQYASELNVHTWDVVEAVKRVMASKYGLRAVAYRVRHGYADQETPMAVLVLPMIAASRAGVAYTGETTPAGREATTVYAVEGLGESLVDGTLQAQSFTMSRPDGSKPPALLSISSGGRTPIMNTADAGAVASHAWELHDLFGTPQDVEWAESDRGELFILQSRPLRTEVDSCEASEEEPDISKYVPLLKDLEVASGGVAAGPVYRVRSPKDYDSIPPGAIVITQTLPPCLARYAAVLTGVLSRSGSRASHFASVAREQGLPVLVGGGDALNELQDGQDVTLDGRNRYLWQGRVEPLLPDADAPACRPASAERYKDLLPFISRLNLVDPDDPSFTPEKFRSMHDVVRFCHEKGVGEMFDLVGKGGRGMHRARKLNSKLPLVMYVLDLGEGLFEQAKSKSEVTPDDIKSQPMWSFWWGLSDESVPWDQNQIHVDWEEFDKASSGLFTKDSKLFASYAVISGNYMHLMVRFGYHFSVLDSVCGPEDKNNYINFRFKGGGGNFNQRSLRLEYISIILDNFGFKLDTKGDMLDAKWSRGSEGETQKVLAVMGKLLAVTRMMDMGLSGEEEVRAMAQRFLKDTRPRADY